MITTAYCDIPTAQSYFDGRLNTSAWDSASDSDKSKSLLQSTRAIDRLNFIGVKTNVWNNTLFKSPVGVQDLEWPRNGSTVIPDEIISAICENALALLDGVDPEQELNRISVMHQGFVGLRETFDTSFTNEHYRAGIASGIAWTFLKPLLQDPRAIRIAKTS